MKIPASRVPAQVWADRAKSHYGDLAEPERAVLEYWEGSKQVYRVNDGLWNEMSIDEAEELPMSLLSRLPYDCLFIQHRETIEAPLIEGSGTIISVIEREGYFCFRDGDGFHIAALNGRVDGFEAAENTITPLPVNLGNCKNVSDCMDVADRKVSVYAERAKHLAMTMTGIAPKDNHVEFAARLMMEAQGVSDLGNILGTLMYISSKEADVRTVHVPQKNQSRRSRQTDCTVHDVGFRIAPQLAEARRVYEHDAKGQADGKTGRHVAPHVRRGHWHAYWTGPRDSPTGLEIKWIAPTVVNASRGELEGTVHDAGKDDERYTVKSVKRECGRGAKQLNGDDRPVGQMIASPASR